MYSKSGWLLLYIRETGGKLKEELTIHRQRIRQAEHEK